mgnify:CR=1 FL=1|jgi:hypothetical protein
MHLLQYAQFSKLELELILFRGHLNVGFGLWLLAAPWLLEGASVTTSWTGVLTGLAVIALSLPRGKISKEHYGSWDRAVV